MVVVVGLVVVVVAFVVVVVVGLSLPSSGSVIPLFATVVVVVASGFANAVVANVQIAIDAIMIASNMETVFFMLIPSFN